MNASRSSHSIDSTPSLRWLVLTAVSIALILSMLALYAKLYFWGGQQYSPFYIKAATWFLIAAGPAAAVFHKQKTVPLLLVVTQLVIIIAASI